jgi:hypothetical protein
VKVAVGVLAKVKVVMEVLAKVKVAMVVLPEVEIVVVKFRDRCRAPVVVELRMEFVMVVNEVRIPSPLIVMVTLKLDVGM